MKISSFFILLFIVFSCNKNSNKVAIISKKLNNIEVVKTLDSLKIVNQFNKDFKIQSLKGKVHIVNFFFTTCQSICPAMENNLIPIVESNSETQFLSFTIDPDVDNVKKLKEHSEKLGNNKNWMFLNANKLDVKKIASIYLSSIDTQNEDAFYHTTAVVLIDRDMNIRGLYDVLIPEELAMLKQDLNTVMQK